MKKLLPIIGVVVLLLGGAVYWFMLKPSGPKVSPVAAQVQADKDAQKELKRRLKERIDGPVVHFEKEFLVNLDDPSLRHFAKFEVAMMVDSETPLAAGAAHGAEGGSAIEEEAEVRDIIIDTASGFRAEELATANGREELKKLIAERVPEHTTTLPLHVFFTSFAVQ